MHVRNIFGAPNKSKFFELLMGHTGVPHNADHKGRQSARADMSNITAAVVHIVWARKPHADRRI